jgi:thymidylate synthase (FAD)
VPHEFFVPAVDEVRGQFGKPGAYSFEPLEPEIAKDVTTWIADWNDQSYALYKEMIEAGVAKELARVVLPVSMYTQFYWTVNARALMNFLSLRTHETAQYDIRQYANAVYEIVAAEMPVTFEAWEKNGRITP